MNETNIDIQSALKLIDDVVRRLPPEETKQLLLLAYEQFLQQQAEMNEAVKRHLRIR